MSCKDPLGGTHHHACDCREAHFADLERRLSEVTAAKNGAIERGDRLEARLAEVTAERDAAQARIQELLEAMVRFTRETPYAEEEGNVRALIAEVGTLRGQLAEVTQERDAARAEVHRLEAGYRPIDQDSTWSCSRCDATRARLAEIEQERDVLKVLLNETAAAGGKACKLWEGALAQVRDLEQVVERMREVADAARAIRGRWEGALCIVSPACGNCGPCRFERAIAHLDTGREALGAASLPGHQMDAPGGPRCECGEPSTHESGWCGKEHPDDMCPDCCTPWKCNGCEWHGDHNCEICYVGAASLPPKAGEP